MLHSVQQLVNNCVYLLFGAEKVIVRALSLKMELNNKLNSIKIHTDLCDNDFHQQVMFSSWLFV